MFENQKLMELAGILTVSRDHDEVMGIIVSQAAKIFNADRACLIVKTEEEKLRVEHGFPKVAHILGTDLLPETGEFFFREVLAIKNPQFVEDVTTDPRTIYLDPLVKLYGISSLLAIPILHHDEPLGVLVLDFINGHRADEAALGKARFISHIAAIAIWKENMRALDLERMPIYDLGKNIAGVSHIIGNRLFHIKGFSSFMKEIAVEDEVRVMAEKIYKAACDIDSFVREIRQFTLPKDLKAEFLNISEFLIDEITEISALECFSAVEFRYDLNPEIPIVRAYARHLKDCIHSILMNAVHAMIGLEKKQIVIKSFCSDDGRSVVFSIANNGEKIDPSLEDKIFDSWVTTKEHGTGLGLANARTIVEMYHGGKIWVAREPMTEFFISIPI